ncbi:MAG: coproporphyrinogen dehydrogenase HemZ [Ruminococcaceae bacterium]|nr:coproporphyrinogen dehydrogenase HemZ [Oscillospiraceae bacterium]
MKIRVDGEINLSYVQNLSLLFFPGMKFSQSEEETPEIPAADVTVRRDEDGYYSKVTLRLLGNVAQGENKTLFDPLYTEERIKKIAVGAAYYNAGRKLLDYDPPWGILTGIRPAKIAGNLYKSLNNKLHVRRALIKDYLLSPKKAMLVTKVAVNEQKLLNKYGKDTCSLYISIPFCPTRCAYCSFVSYSTPRLLSMIPDYLACLERDIADMVQVIKARGQRIVTVYVGGGTPTTLSADQIRQLIAVIAKHVDLSSLAEFTIEAGRPDTITADKLDVMTEGGVNRISINPQTLNDEVLRGIGRCHTTDDFFSAYYMARDRYNFDINVDLIAGLPGDSFMSFSKTVDQIIHLAPENLTIHTLCAKKAADMLKSGFNVFSRSSAEAVKSVDYSQVAAMNAGYHPYYLYRQKNTVANLENVGFAFPGHEGIYNALIMADEHDIYAVGAAAVSKIIGSDGKIHRSSMPKYPYEYLETEANAEQREAYFSTIAQIE